MFRVHIFDLLLLVLCCRFVQEPLHRNPPRSVSVCAPRVAQPLPQLHQVHPRSHHQSADADLSRHQVGHCQRYHVPFAPVCVFKTVCAFNKRGRTKPIWFYMFLGSSGSPFQTTNWAKKLARYGGISSFADDLFPLPRHTLLNSPVY